MISDEIVNKRERQCQYLTMVMESLQCLTQQGISFHGNDDLENNFTQLLLRAKEYSWVKERIMSQESGTKKYNHHDFQDEIWNIMAKQILRKKLFDVNNSKMYASMCDEYTDVSNKRQLSICVCWVDEDLTKIFLVLMKYPISRPKLLFLPLKMRLSDLTFHCLIFVGKHMMVPAICWERKVVLQLTLSLYNQKL